MVFKQDLTCIGDGSLSQAAKIMGLPPKEFRRLLPDLQKRFPPFPAPDPTTGMLDLDAINQWRRLRYPHLFSLTDHSSAYQLSQVDMKQRLETLRGQKKG
jgi:hypothetical protein